VVTKIGYVYDGDESYHFVEITDSANGYVCRLMYVDPAVAVGQIVEPGAAIGTTQDLSLRYPNGITNHVHVELADAEGRALNPENFPILPRAMVSRDASAATGGL
jgi:hypothetical protein